MSTDFDQLVGAARRHDPKPTLQQRAKMKRSMLATAAVGSASASALSLAKLVAVGLCSAVAGSVAAVGVTHALSSAHGVSHAPVRSSVRGPLSPPRAAEPLPGAVPTREAASLVSSVTVVPNVPALAPSPSPSNVSPVKPRAVVQAAEASSSAPVTADIASGPGAGHFVAADEPVLPLELKLVREAADAVDAKDFEAAAAALERYDRHVNGGALATEAGVLHVWVDCAKDDVTEARRRTAVLIARDPSNPSLAQLRTSCAAAEFLR